jgi:hypothetical protein
MQVLQKEEKDMGDDDDARQREPCKCELKRNPSICQLDYTYKREKRKRRYKDGEKETTSLEV